MTTVASLTDSDVQHLAVAWYKKLDIHAPLEELLPLLADETLVMNFPEGTQRGHAGFTNWYNTVTRKFFDEVHTLKQVDVQLTPEGANVKVIVNWQAHTWNPPAARSQWLGFDAYQSWVVARDPNSQQPVIVVYTVDNLKAMPGSPDL